jgi:hypothetical protein
MNCNCPRSSYEIKHTPECYDALAAQLATADGYALLLVDSLARRFPAVEGFRPLPDLLGKLTQIDNMTAKLPEGFGQHSESK